MTTPKITGNEPYYPFLTSNSDWPDVINITDETGRNLLNFVPGITIRQKFIADYVIKNRSQHVECDALLAEAQQTFQSYIKIINGE